MSFELELFDNIIVQIHKMGTRSSLSPPLYFYFYLLTVCDFMGVYLICNHTADLQIRPNEVMEAGARVYIPVSVAETRISKRFDTIPSGTLYPNADEIEYLQRLVKYKACLTFNS